MGILNTIGKKVKGVLGQIDTIKKDMEQENKDYLRLRKWKDRLSISLSEHSNFRSNCVTWDNIYNGTHAVGGAMGYEMSYSKTDRQQIKSARQVVNITSQLIESQINIDIPTPSVKAVEGSEDLGKREMLEGMLTYLSAGAELERMTSDNERIVKKNGMAIFKVNYNPDFKSHNFRGRIETSNPHPTLFVPQTNIHRLADMDYCFFIVNKSLDSACRMYGEQYRDALDIDGAEYGYFDNFTEQTTDNLANKVSVIECWYKDSDGDICLLTWSAETILRDTPKFYYKRLKNEIQRTEKVQIIDADGNPKTVDVECHIPKRFPFVIWYNIPKEKSFRGRSDVDIISDQQEGIKKVLSIEEEKQLKGTTKILVRSGVGLKESLDNNAVTQIVETDDPQSDVRVVDLKSNEGGLIQLYNIYMQAAKDSIGVTEASQGRAESSALSGTALQTLTQNTENKMGIKKFEKHMAFGELYRIYYDFVLAFYDEEIPFRVKGPDSKSKFGMFDKGMLIKQDKDGKWYYPDFDIYVEADSGMPKDKSFIIRSMSDALARGAINSIDYWMVMESIDFPNAAVILKSVEDRMAHPIMQAPPRVTIAYKDMTADGQTQLLNYLGIQVDPQSMPITNQAAASVKIAEETLPQGQNAQPPQVQQAPQSQQQPSPAPQGQQQLDPQFIAEQIAQLPPELQKEFLQMNPEEQKAMINKFYGG